jgi:surface-anchored protein
MNTQLLLLAALLALTGAPRLTAQCFQFTEEHVDLLALFWNAESNSLSLMASDDTHGALYASNQCVVIAPESTKFTLPAGTPFGNEGDSLWILPQNPYPGVPYIGVSAENLPAGSFNDPLSIQLKRVEGPGQFMVWQTTGIGTFDIKMDTRNGIGLDDRLTPFVGGHEHHNWGFTTSGVYRVYFQAVGRRPGQSANIVSADTPFTFHVLPLKPFETWTATNWPCECRTNLILAGANPDGDAGANAAEYALGTNPKVATTNGWPTAGLVTDNGQTYGALTYTRAKAAPDVTYEVVAASSITATTWQPITIVHGIVDLGATERVTMRDTVPASSGQQRYFQLRIRLQ